MYDEHSCLTSVRHTSPNVDRNHTYPHTVPMQTYVKSAKCQTAPFDCANQDLHVLEAYKYMPT